MVACLEKLSSPPIYLGARQNSAYRSTKIIVKKLDFCMINLF